MTTQTTTTPRRAAQRLNDHQERKMHGFYCSNGGRYFMARVRDGQLHCSPDFGKTWHVIDLGLWSFHDAYGQPLYL